MYPWDDWDWGSGDYGFCDCDGCEICDLQQEWWAEMLPYLPFWHDGLIHITNAQNYGSACGRCRLGNHFESSEQALTYAEVARVQHEAVTCIECLAAWKPEAQSL